MFLDALFTVIVLFLSLNDGFKLNISKIKIVYFNFFCLKCNASVTKIRFGAHYHKRPHKSPYMQIFPDSRTTITFVIRKI